MAIHVLIPCSKTKSVEPVQELVWKEGASIENWVSAWENIDSDLLEPGRLYTGRATNNQLEMVLKRNDAYPYIISAGAGLIPVKLGKKIPSYEATFGKHGPSVDDWFKLPFGGLSNIQLEEDDVIVAFAPPMYLSAISKDPWIERFWKNIVASESSCLGRNCGFPVKIHPRTKDILGVAAADLNTELIKIFLESGLSEIERFSEKAGKLPPPPKRRKVSNEELLEVVKEHHEGKTSIQLIRYIRDNLKISASVERIGKARKSAYEEKR